MAKSGRGLRGINVDYLAADMATAEALLERLVADHRHFGELLEQLEKNATQLRPNADGARDTELLPRLIASLTDYVNGGHHEVEEIVFAALVDGGVGFELEAELAELRDDHEQLAARAATVLSSLEQLQSKAAPDAPLPPRVVDFCHYERHHMTLEGERVFPAIGEVLEGERWEVVRRQLLSWLASESEPRS